MLFNTQAFAIFFVLVWLGAWLLRRAPTPRVLWLLAASYLFYGWWDWAFLGLIVFSTGLDYGLGLAMGRARAAGRQPPRALLMASLVGNLGVLGFFKYWDFFAAELAAGLAVLGVASDPLLLELVLPVGISFYTFQTLSYTFDVYRGQLEPEPNLARFALFVAFFPQLVAGPIVRARHFLPQLRQPPQLAPADFERGLALIAQGLVKKVVIADVLGSALVDPFWRDPAAYGGVASWLAIAAYAFQIYGDFSGYSDMAIGTARLLGFSLGDNFRAPYRTTHPREFWTRWHISLSGWLRDYLYIPLGGSRGSRLATTRNLLLTMLLGGLWHGASWMFVLWGGYHGALLVLDRALGLREPSGVGGRWLARVGMFQLTCLGWVFFRSPDPASAADVLASLFGPRGSADVWTGLVPAVFVLAVVSHLPPRAWLQRARAGFLAWPGLVQGAVYAVVFGLVLKVSGLAVPFIYFQF